VVTGGVRQPGGALSSRERNTSSRAWSRSSPQVAGYPASGWVKAKTAAESGLSGIKSAGGAADKRLVKQRTSLRAYLVPHAESVE